ncbi:MAG: SRPBCC domain-containing protein [Saprospiraceae bacterium]
MKEFVVRKKIAIQAEPSQVWDALTNPEKTVKYFFNCKVNSKWKVGSPITFKGKILLIKKIELKGQILQIEPGKLLKYSLKNEDDDNAEAGNSTVTDELIYKDGKTILSITDDVGQGQGAEERYLKSKKGWDKVLKGLKELVEEG